jgi:hypothetical protein
MDSHSQCRARERRPDLTDRGVSQHVFVNAQVYLVIEYIT